MQTQYSKASDDAKLVDRGIDIDSWFVLNGEGQLTAIYPVAAHVVGQYFEERTYFRDVIDGQQQRPYVGTLYDSKNINKHKLPMSILITTQHDGEPQSHVLVASVSAPGSKVQDLINSLKSQIMFWTLVSVVPIGVFLLALILKAANSGLRRLK